MGYKIRIPRSVLKEMTLQELGRHIYEITNGFSSLSEKEKDDKKKGPKADVEDAEQDAVSKGAKATKPGEEAPKDKPDASADQGDGKKGPDQAAPAGPPVQPTPEEPTDDDMAQQQADAPDEPGDEEEVGGDVSDEITGKTVQSITLEPKSKLMPGAQELVITFSEISDPLRVLIAKGGGVKFYFRGLHNEL